MTIIKRCFVTLFLLIALAGCSAGDDRDTTGNDETDDRIDLIVAGDYVVTMDAADAVIENGAVAVDDGVIVAVGGAAEIDAAYSARERLEGDARIVMPGLVNGHSHAAMTLLRGVADDLALMDWLNNYIFPAEVQFVDTEFVRVRTYRAALGLPAPYGERVRASLERVQRLRRQ